MVGAKPLREPGKSFERLLRISPQGGNSHQSEELQRLLAGHPVSQGRQVVGIAARPMVTARRVQADLEQALQGFGALGRPTGQAADELRPVDGLHRSEEHTSELQSLMRNSYAVFCL